MSLSDLSNLQAGLCEAAAEVERLTRLLLDAGAAEGIDDVVVQRLFHSAVELFEHKHDAGLREPFLPGRPITATSVAVTASAMLAAVELEVFELGMWQAWSGGRER